MPKSFHVAALGADFQLISIFLLQAPVTHTLKLGSLDSHDMSRTIKLAVI